MSFDQKTSTHKTMNAITTVPLTKVHQVIAGYDSIIKKAANSIAFRFRQEPSDLISLFYEKLLTIPKIEIESKRQFTSFIYQCLTNHAINAHRKASKQPKEDFEYYTNDQRVSHNPSYDSKELAWKIINGIRKELQRKSCPSWLILYDEVILGQMKYHEAAERLKIPINTVKTRIRYIRQIAEKKYGKQYRDFIE